jgi:hypothetical protein
MLEVTELKVELAETGVQHLISISIRLDHSLPADGPTIRTVQSVRTRLVLANTE